MKTDLPKRVFEKNGSFYLVASVGKQRKWTKLCRVRDGLPAMYMALAKLTAAEVKDDSMTRLVADWLIEVSSTHAKSTRANDSYMCREIAKAFVEFRSSQVRPPHVLSF